MVILICNQQEVKINCPPSLLKLKLDEWVVIEGVENIF